MRVVSAYPTSFRSTPRSWSVALLGAAVAACFAIGNAHAASDQPANPGWSPDTSLAVEQAYTQFPAADQGGPSYHPNTAALARQGGPGWDAPDMRVDTSTQVQSSAATAAPMAAHAARPDHAAVTASILFPPGSTALSGEAPAVLNNIATLTGDLSGRVIVTGRSDGIEHGGGVALSLARGQHVADYLARAGVDPQRIELRALGNSRPLIDPAQCTSLAGADRAACLAPDRSVTVRVGRTGAGGVEMSMADID